ncbi:MAG: LacI family DNA-binding transcriptional regulator [Ruminococcus sp.]|nr:LacI family DNA-binding transcriptional regulator [Ruminococcus sp.]
MSLKEISAMTGVSVSTVGRILSDPAHRCANEETRKKVLEAARTIGYVPNAAARSLKSGKSIQEKIYSINILLTRSDPESSDPFYDELLMLLEKELRSSSCIVHRIMRCNELSDSRIKTPQLEALTDSLFSADNGADGLIVIGKLTHKAVSLLKAHEKNIVSINRDPTNHEIDEVLCDGGRIAREAVAYLAKLGHTKIGFVGGCHHEARFTGYQQALSELRLPLELDHIYDTTPGEAHGLAALQYFKGLSDPPTAIYCANDILAVGMIKGMDRRRIRDYFPSVISSDDIDAAQYTRPMLTTISLPKTEMVRFALMLLLDRIKGGHKTVSRLELEGRLIIRESCRHNFDQAEPEYYI